MKVWVLTDNVARSPKFKSEHGLSYYIETENRKILFDAGLSSAFAENAEKLGISLKDVDFAILSHGHSDHGGGLEHFLSINRKAKIYMATDALEEHFNKANEYIGLNPDLIGHDRIEWVEDDLLIDHLSIHSPNSKMLAKSGEEEFDTFGLKAFRDGKLCPDRFDHERYLVVREQGKKFVFSGCSHRGILNILKWFDPDVLLGGFHFFRYQTYGSDAEKLMYFAEELMKFKAVYYTSHCTGIDQFEFLQVKMGDKIRYLAAGDFVEI